MNRESIEQLKRIAWPCLIYMALGFVAIFGLDWGILSINGLLIYEAVLFVLFLVAIVIRIKDYKLRYLFLGKRYKFECEKHMSELFAVDYLRKMQYKVARDFYRKTGKVNFDIPARPMDLYPMPEELRDQPDKAFPELVEKQAAFEAEAVERFVRDYRYRFMFMFEQEILKVYFSKDGRERMVLLHDPQKNAYLMAWMQLSFHAYEDYGEYYLFGGWIFVEDERVMKLFHSEEELLFELRFLMLDFTEDMDFPGRVK